MDKILLFGASLGGQNFIKNHAYDYEYLAILDNDTAKHGLLFNNIEIVSPNNIRNYNYDKIIVASMYVDSISEQLNDLGVPNEKIEFASKNSMKIDKLPFEDPQILEKANQLIFEISDCLKEVPHFYTFGTLLGIARDGGLIPWDDDIDIAIFAKQTEVVQHIILNHVHKFEQFFDVKIFRRTYSNGKPASITIDCLEAGRKLFMVNFDCMHCKGEWVNQELNDTPKHFFDGHDELDFHGFAIQVPKDYKSYLNYTYGDWHVVKKNTSFANNTNSFREPLYQCSTDYIYESK